MPRGEVITARVVPSRGALNPPDPPGDREGRGPKIAERAGCPPLSGFARSGPGNQPGERPPPSRAPGLCETPPGASHVSEALGLTSEGALRYSQRLRNAGGAYRQFERTPPCRRRRSTPPPPTACARS